MKTLNFLVILLVFVGMQSPAHAAAFEYNDQRLISVKSTIDAARTNIANITKKIGLIATDPIGKDEAVKKAALEIRSLATKSFGKESNSSKTLTTLIGEIEAVVNAGYHGHAINPNVSDSVKETYTVTLSKLEERLSPLTKLQTLTRQTYRELIEEGDQLMNMADAMAFTKQACSLLREAGQTDPEKSFSIPIKDALEKIKGKLEKTLASLTASLKSS